MNEPGVRFSEERVFLWESAMCAMRRILIEVLAENWDRLQSILWWRNGRNSEYERPIGHKISDLRLRHASYRQAGAGNREIHELRWGNYEMGRKGLVIGRSRG